MPFPSLPPSPHGSDPATPPVGRAPHAPLRWRWRRYERPEPPLWRVVLVHLGLFLITLYTTTVAGAEQVTAKSLWSGWWPSVAELKRGLAYSIPFLAILTVHEFGHYFTARYNRIRTSLPYYIPILNGLLDIGTFGAVIQIRDKIFSRREFFDVGIAGPLAGLVVAVGVLVYGLTHLPPLEYLFQVHPEYRFYGADYARHVYNAESFGVNPPLLYHGLAQLLADPARLPHLNELMHYPYLLAGVLGLFFTALNLLPIGQLDGGHILYGLLGFRRGNQLSAVLFLCFIFYAGLGLFSFNASRETWLYGVPVYLLYLFFVLRRVLPTPRRVWMLVAGVLLAQLAVTVAFPGIEGNPGWLLFGLLLGRVTSIYHPPATDERPLSPGRQVLGWLMLAVFVLCFSPSPFR
ncbi:site-2 protease family protein [Hymenobacter oligotrophus]|uniref:site-2 protease family protein n=1 Tax=Hymenobacter oligotrophus TaxID=2319843 RepID=UPI001F09D91E|nr:site-2 protease family protein [Hymenobacter oligotrophus]